ncbi:hypothetical protein [Rhizobium sp. CECT 9324]|uniref:hypothetical protein n=1 Tax=Rhizobium sp. CECT 9324 TaxID=2845820 RepID=UPI001E514661|nr:hypothetical protein [Rhizobium sp. CECT 9324]CAH0343682.1 hypothetical protein RHI9324_05419 [Rhizobium sp. CECT 9324]
MNENKEVLRTIDMTPTWEETVQMLVALIERGDAAGRATAISEMQRMARLADIASIVIGAHRRPDAPSHKGADAIVAALSSWRELLAYDAERPVAGTRGAEIYTRAEEAKAQLDAISRQSAN